MTRFEQALLDRLTDHVQDTPTTAHPHRRRVRPALVAAAVAAAAATAAALAIAGPFAAEPAYAVTKHADGKVSLTLREMADPAKATRDLRAAGLPARVLRLSAPGTCPAPAGSGTPWQPSNIHAEPGAFSFYGVAATPDLDFVTGYIANAELSSRDIKDLTFTLVPSAIPAGVDLVIVEFPHNGGIVVTVGLIHAPAPTCWESAR
jgi:hypothetical protein